MIFQYIKKGQSEVGGQFAHRSLHFISFYQIKNMILKKPNMKQHIAKNASSDDNIFNC